MTITTTSSITCSPARAPPFCTKPGAILRTPAPAPPRLIRYAALRHDLAVQQLVLNRLSRCLEVIWDRHIRLPPPFDRPDVLMLTRDHFWIAFRI